jgi:hypothetical protein
MSPKSFLVLFLPKILKLKYERSSAFQMLGRPWRHYLLKKEKEEFC